MENSRRKMMAVLFIEALAVLDPEAEV
jgi:hypothetical protein